MTTPKIDEHMASLQVLTNYHPGRGGAMIRGLQPARVPFIPDRPRPGASLGAMRNTPNEVAMMFLEHLDIQSITRFSQVCSTTKAFVDSMMPYRQLIHYCPHTLTALGKTQLLKHYTCEQVLEALRADECVSCHAYGGHLFLPTLERVCVVCLDRNASLRVMRVADAQNVFTLTDQQLTEIPVMKTIPGDYGISNQISKKRSFYVVSVKQAKQLSLRIHGSMEVVTDLSTRFYLDARRKNPSHLALLDAPLDPPGRDMSRMEPSHGLKEDLFAGMASVWFPTLTRNGLLDYGRLCRGCEVMHLCYKDGFMPDHIARELSEPVHPRGPLRAAACRLHSLERFGAHVRTCHGTRYMRARERAHSPQVQMSLDLSPLEDPRG